MDNECEKSASNGNGNGNSLGTFDISDNSTAVTVPNNGVASSPSSNEERVNKHQTNYVQTLMLLLNGFVGSGILLVPHAFKDGGIVLATVLNPLIGLLACYCIHLLLSANQFVMQATNRPPLEYHEVAEFAFRLGPARLRSWARTARIIVVFALVATQLGACSAYFLFISVNLNKFLVNTIGAKHAPSIEQLLALILPVVVGLNWIRSIRHLSIFSTLSNCLQLAGISIIFYNLLCKPLPDISQLPKVGDKIPQYFVSTLFVYEGITEAMSLFKAIDKKKNFSKPSGVLNVGLFIITIIYLLLGFLGFARYGLTVQSSITLSLASTPLYDSVQLMYAVAILFTYPLILYVPIQILWSMIEKQFFSQLEKQQQKTTNTQELAKINWTNSAMMMACNLSFRTGLVLFTYVLAAAIPRLDQIIALVGSITSSSIVITIPAILNTVIFWEQSKGFCSKLRLLTINGTIMGIGILAFGFGAYTSIVDIFESYKNGQEFQNDDQLNNATIGLLNSTTPAMR